MQTPYGRQVASITDIMRIRRRRNLIAIKGWRLNIFYNAGTLIVICGPSAAPFAADDGWLAAENLMIAAIPMIMPSRRAQSSITPRHMPLLRQPSVERRDASCAALVNDLQQ